MHRYETQLSGMMWYTKYTKALGLATIKVLEEKKLPVDKYLEELIHFNWDPVKADITNLRKLSETENGRGVPKIHALTTVLEIVKRITEGGEEREYFNLANTSIRFHAIFHISGKLHRDIQIMEYLLKINLYGDLR
jgi:hypothetical protein